MLRDSCAESVHARVTLVGHAGPACLSMHKAILENGQTIRTIILGNVAGTRASDHARAKTYCPLPSVSFQAVMLNISSLEVDLAERNHGAATGTYKVGAKHAFYGGRFQISESSMQALLAFALSFRPHNRYAFPRQL